MADVHPFRIAIPDDVLADLKHRLERTRWPDPECVDDWSQGIPLTGKAIALADDMDAAGIHGAILHPPSWDPHSNAQAIDAARRYPDRFAIRQLP